MGDLLLGLFAELLFGGFAPAREETAPEGEWNASMGSLAAFVAAVGLLFGAVWVTFRLAGEVSDAPAGLFPGITIGGSLLAGWLAHRTFRVTARRHALARAALWMAGATLVAMAVAMVFGR